MNVLFIEDDYAVVDTISSAARQKGVTLHHAHKLEDARKIAATTNIDLIWTDIGLPGGERGTDILQEIMSVPAVIYTGYEKSSIAYDRYWKHVNKLGIAGYGSVSIMLRMRHAADFMLAIIEGKDDPAMGRFSSNEISKKIDALQRSKIERLFLKETECLDAWLSGDRDKSATIAAGLLDGSLC